MQILYGKNVVFEVLKAKRRKVHQLFLEGHKGVPKDKTLLEKIGPKGAPLGGRPSFPVSIIDGEEIRNLTRDASHQGIALKADDYPYVPFDELLSKHSSQALFAMCDSLQDPQNLGTICRSAYCFGVDGIILNKDRSVEVTPTVVKASAGAVEHLPICRVTNLSRTLELLKEAGFWSYAAIPQAHESLLSLKPSPKMVVVLGNEGEGIRPLVAKTCDISFHIPMVRPFDSLNVAQAASILFFTLSRLRNF